MIQSIADGLTVAGLLIIYVGIATGVSVAGTALWLKAKELWRR